MRAIVITRPGGPEVLQPKELPSPAPSRGEVRVRVRATAVNRADVLQRMGMYPAPADAPDDVPGLEMAGEVDALGEGVTELAVGDRVCGLVGGGAYAEQVVTHARTLARVPAGLSFTDAAALPEACTTAYDALVAQARLRSGEWVLVHAAGSGVGTAAVQIARAIGARVVGTARTAEKLERCAPLGLDARVVVGKDGRFADAVREATGGQGADVVLELVGGGYVGEDLGCTATEGRVVLVGLMAGAATEIDLGALLRRRITLTGTVLRARPLEQKIEAGRLFARHVMPLVERGLVRAIVDRVLPLERVAEAHDVMTSNATFGKIVLEV